ncbi:hypothetical protein [Haladaptatus sp. NG-SE-30]
MVTESMSAKQAGFIPTERMHQTGIAAIIGGILIVSFTLLSIALGIEENTRAEATISLLYALGSLLVLAGLYGIHQMVKSEFSHIATGIAGVLAIGLIGIAIGLTTNFVFPTVRNEMYGSSLPIFFDATIGGIIWFLSLLVTSLAATAYGLILLRTPTVSRVGAVLLVSTIAPLLVIIVMAIMYEFVLYVPAHVGSEVLLLFGGVDTPTPYSVSSGSEWFSPFGLAWIFLGNELRTRTDTGTESPVHTGER